MNPDDDVFCQNLEGSSSPSVNDKGNNIRGISAEKISNIDGGRTPHRRASRTSSLDCEQRDGIAENGNALLTNSFLAVPGRSPLRSSLIKDGSRSRRTSPGGAGKSVSFSTMSTEKKISNVADCLSHMQNGSEMMKIRGNARRYRRHFSLDADCSHLRWTPTNKKPHRAKVTVETIKEIRVGRNTENLRSSDSCFEDVQEDCAFSIIWGDEYQCLDLIASSPDEANIWVTGLMALTSGNCPETSTGRLTDRNDRTSFPSSSTLRERWLEGTFKIAAADQPDGMLSEKECLKLVKNTNPRVLSSKIKQKLKELDSHKLEGVRGKFSCPEFCDLYKDISTRPEIYFLMVRYANKDYLTWEDLQLFLETEQGIDSATKELCQNVIRRYEASAEGRAKDLMTVDGFTNFLQSEECALFDPIHRSVCQDMSQPLNHYFFAASHNTYLVEDQLKGPSSVEGYIRALKRGCRFIEMDIWQSEEFHEPVVYHGHTLTSKLPIHKALLAVRDYAFEASLYPLVIKMEQHLELSYQKQLAAYLKEYFGDMLYTWSNVGADKMFLRRNSVGKSVLPSPEMLKRKILLLSKKLPEGSTEPEGEVSEEDESSETNRAARAARKCAQERRNVLCKELSDLICPFLVSNYLKDLHSAVEKPNRNAVWSLNETQCLRVAHNYADELTALTRDYLTRIYPNAVRVDSSNQNPQEFWNYGAQIVSLNYQTPGLMMDLQDGRFSANGSCGFVLKPSMMRDELGHFMPRDQMPLSYIPQVLHLKIISAQQLPRPRGSTAKGDSADPYVVIEVFGVPSDCAEERTKTVKNDSFNPSFDESFQFQINVPDLALVRFLVLDDDYIGDDFIGQYTIPFECLLSGYRHFRLLSHEGDPMENSTLFVHVAVTNKRGGGKPKKRGMSVKRKNNKIHTGIKMVGLKHLDDLFKDAVLPLAECIQLKTTVENAMMEWQETCGLGPAGTVRQGLRLLYTRLQTASSSTVVDTVASSPDDQTGSSQDSEALPLGMEIYYEGNELSPRVSAIGAIPEQLKKAFGSLEVLLVRCTAIIEGTDHLLHKLDEATRKIAESHDGLNSLFLEAGLRGQKATRASENFAWNVRLLKGQIEQMHKTQQEARSMLQQVGDTGCLLNVLRDPCVQPCIHRSRTTTHNV